MKLNEVWIFGIHRKTGKEVALTFVTALTDVDEARRAVLDEYDLDGVDIQSVKLIPTSRMTKCVELYEKTKWKTPADCIKDFQEAQMPYKVIDDKVENGKVVQVTVININENSFFTFYYGVDRCEEALECYDKSLYAWVGFGSVEGNEPTVYSYQWRGGK